MKAEYFPPKVDIILQNEIPTDFYILVSGSVVENLSYSHVYHHPICKCSNVNKFHISTCRTWWYTKMAQSRYPSILIT